VGVVLVAGAIIQCTHGGTRKIASGDSRLEVAGKGAITYGMEGGLSFAPGAPDVISPCPMQTPAGAPSPCSATTPATSGIASKLDVGNMPALLDGAGGLTVNASDPSARWSVASSGQTPTKLEAS
jgi:hypothetical protein